MEITGTIKHISETESGTSKSGKAWQKVEIVIEETGQYPNSVVISAMNERISELTDFRVGTPVRAIYNSKAREYKGKYYNTLNLFKLQLPQGYGTAPQQQQQAAAATQSWAPQQPIAQQQPLWQQNTPF